MSFNINGYSVKQKVDAYGRVLSEIWRNNSGEIHREGLPAVILYDSLGEVPVRAQYHFKNGKLHNERGPAITEFEREGMIRIDVWCREGKRHRLGDPAVTVTAVNTGIVAHEQWFENDHLHRAKGYADIHRHWKTGAFGLRESWRDGVHRWTSWPDEVAPYIY